MPCSWERGRGPWQPASLEILPVWEMAVFNVPLTRMQTWAGVQPSTPIWHRVWPHAQDASGLDRESIL